MENTIFNVYHVMQISVGEDAETSDTYQKEVYWGSYKTEQGAKEQIKSWLEELASNQESIIKTLEGYCDGDNTEELYEIKMKRRNEQFSIKNGVKCVEPIFKIKPYKLGD
jgi:hypothetical protein